MSKTHSALRDEDHVLRLVWLALCDTAANGAQQIKDCFDPEPADPAAVTGLADGRHPRDGCEIHDGANASPSLPDASVIIFRRGGISADPIVAAPKLRLIERLRVRPEGIDLAAATAAGVAVSCLPRHTLAHTAEHALGVSYRPLDAVLAAADFVSVHASNIAPNDRLIGRAAFAAMKFTAFFINTSRGRLVDADALFDALANRTIAGAGRDVHRVEPRPAHDRFAALPTVVMTPHLAGGSRLSLRDEAAAIFATMRAALAGAPPPHGCILP